MTHKSETIIAAAIGLLAEFIAVSLFACAFFVWLVVLKTGGINVIGQ